MQYIKFEDVKDRLSSMSGPIDLGQGAAVDKCLTDLTLKLGKNASALTWLCAKMYSTTPTHSIMSLTRLRHYPSHNNVK